MLTSVRIKLLLCFANFILTRLANLYVLTVYKSALLGIQGIDRISVQLICLLPPDFLNHVSETQD